LSLWLQEMGTAISIVAIAIAAAPLILLGLGFSATGPVAGSMAAKWMAAAGPIEANSIYAMLQRLGMVYGF
jgi:hypothetical protein